MCIVFQESVANTECYHYLSTDDYENQLMDMACMGGPGGAAMLLEETLETVFIQISECVFPIEFEVVWF